MGSPFRKCVETRSDGPFARTGRQPTRESAPVSVPIHGRRRNGAFRSGDSRRSERTARRRSRESHGTRLECRLEFGRLFGGRQYGKRSERATEAAIRIGDRMIRRPLVRGRQTLLLVRLLESTSGCDRASRVSGAYRESEVLGAAWKGRAEIDDRNHEQDDCEPAVQSRTRPFRTWGTGSHGFQRENGSTVILLEQSSGIMRPANFGDLWTALLRMVASAVPPRDTEKTNRARPRPERDFDAVDLASSATRHRKRRRMCSRFVG
jgi:hypothetical protein